MYFEVSNIYVQSDMASHASGLINLISEGWGLLLVNPT